MGFGTITAIFLVFGAAGYLAFGETTEDPITKSLPEDWTTHTVKLALCLALFFTFPVMMVPVYDILERGAEALRWFQTSVSPLRRCAAAAFRSSVGAHCSRVRAPLLLGWVSWPCERRRCAPARSAWHPSFTPACLASQQDARAAAFRSSVVALRAPPLRRLRAGRRTPNRFDTCLRAWLCCRVRAPLIFARVSWLCERHPVRVEARRPLRLLRE